MSRQKSQPDDLKSIRVSSDAKHKLEAARTPGVELWKFSADVIRVGLASIEMLRRNESLRGVVDYKLEVEKLVAQVGKK